MRHDPWGQGPHDLPTGGWDPAIATAIAQMIAEVPQTGAPAPIAVFDWDETSIRGDISETSLHYLDEAKPGIMKAYEAACQADRRLAYEQLSMDLCAGQTETQVRATVLSVLDRAVRDGLIALRSEIRDLIWRLHRHGWEVWVVTASATPIVTPLAEMYGIHPHRVLGMQCPIGPDGRYLRQLLEPIPYREGKAAAVQHWIGRAPTFAAGDSEGDLWLLRSARYRLLVDRGERGDPTLRAAAHSEGWWVQRGWS